MHVFHTLYKPVDTYLHVQTAQKFAFPARTETPPSFSSNTLIEIDVVEQAVAPKGFMLPDRSTLML